MLVSEMWEQSDAREELGSNPSDGFLLKFKKIYYKKNLNDIFLNYGKFRFNFYKNFLGDGKKKTLKKKFF